MPDKELKQRILDMLNEALALEYNDVFLYLKEADMYKQISVGNRKIAQMFIDYSQTELRHSDILATKITEMGGSPKWDFKIISAKAKLNDVLKQHLEAETHAYFLYGEILKLLLDDEAFKKQIEEIRANEKEHLEVIANLLKETTKFNVEENDETGYEYLDNDN